MEKKYEPDLYLDLDLQNKTKFHTYPFQLVHVERTLKYPWRKQGTKLPMTCYKNQFG